MMRMLMTFILALTIATAFGQRSQKLDTQLQEELKLMSEHLKLDVAQISQIGVALSERNEVIRNPLSVIDAVNARFAVAGELDDYTQAQLNAEIAAKSKLVQAAEEEVEQKIMEYLDEDQQNTYREKTKTALQKLRAAS